MATTVEPYLKENIDERIKIKPLLEKNKFPVFLRDSYNFYEMTILGTLCILIEVIRDMPGLDKLQKHIKQIENITDRQVVLFPKEITRYRRKSLIQNRIPFVINDGQMYLPFLGLDLTKAKENIEKEVKYFTTPAQVAYLFFLYNKDEIMNVTEFAQKMKFNKMTASRALNELYRTNLITYEIGGKTGRSKEYKRIPDPDYFQNGRKYLKTPVKKIIYTKTKPFGAFVSGLDALAGLSMLNPPSHPIRAVDNNLLNNEHIEIVTNKDFIKDTKLIEVQVWNYNPKLFSDTDYVDLMSLYVSMKEETDERVEQALVDILRGETWYTD